MGNLILASTEAASKGSSSGSTTFLLVIVVLIVGMWFLLIRPQRARQRKAMEQQRGVEPGQRVRTTAGMYATVVAVDGDDVILEVAPDVEVRYMKRAVMEVIGDATTVDDETDEDGVGEDDETADHDEHLENETYEEHEEAAVPVGNYGEDLTINGKADTAQANGHETVTTEGTAAKE